MSTAKMNALGWSVSELQKLLAEKNHKTAQNKNGIVTKLGTWTSNCNKISHIT